MEENGFVFAFLMRYYKHFLCPMHFHRISSRHTECAMHISSIAHQLPSKVIHLYGLRLFWLKLLPFHNTTDLMFFPTICCCHNEDDNDELIGHHDRTGNANCNGTWRTKKALAQCVCFCVIGLRCAFGLLRVQKKDNVKRRKKLF